MKQSSIFNYALLLGALVLGSAIPTLAQTDNYFGNWPAGRSPQEVGKRVAEHFVPAAHQYHNPFNYAETATWYGALTFSEVTHDDALRDELIRRYNSFLPGGADDLPITAKHSEDISVIGATPLEIAIQTKDLKYLAQGKAWADHQWETPLPNGLSIETRFWVDDMYMITILQVQTYRATRDKKYLDRAALEMSAYLDKLQQPNGLFFHTPDVPFFWGRGNGWVAAGLTELLMDLPENHPQRARILKGYQQMMEALLKYQGKDGMWRELIDHDESWPESSSSGMFDFAMVTGVKHGWLEARTYGPAARKGWIALAGYIDQNADLTSICEGTGAQNDYEYYMMRKRNTGDFHGQAPVLWTATALLR
jgi:rhamnogalacturonyl hydrolase YesR